jgi:phosphatidylglycerophosphatase A
MLKKYISIFIATGGGVGYFPYISGTIGTLVGIPIYILLSKINPFLYIFISGILFFIGVKSSGYVEELFNVKDSRRIVIDEILGYIVTMFMINNTKKNILIGFILFRLFDILKIFPIRYIDERMEGGYGIVIDDVVAGIYANLIFRILLKYI